MLYFCSCGCLELITITCGQPESFCLSEKYLQSVEAPLVQNSTWRGKSNASLYLSSLTIENKEATFIAGNYLIIEKQILLQVRQT